MFTFEPVEIGCANILIFLLFLTFFVANVYINEMLISYIYIYSYIYRMSGSLSKFFEAHIKLESEITV